MGINLDKVKSGEDVEYHLHGEWVPAIYLGKSNQDKELHVIERGFGGFAHQLSYATDEQLRMKRQTTKIRCRVAVIQFGGGDPGTTTVESEDEECSMEADSIFVEWLGDWMEKEIEL